MEVTEGHLLGGRVRYRQPAHGFRSGIEPVILAAALPARPNERILEGGSGPGAALLCLEARIGGILGIGVERSASLSALARTNARVNGFATLLAVTADVTRLPLRGTFDHACANPPYHAPAGTPSPVAARESAKRAGPGVLSAWASALAAPLRHRGTLTFILPVGLLADCLDAMGRAGCPAATILPLWPKAQRPARLMLIQGIKGGRAAPRILPGLLLHQEDGRFTREADAVLREGAPLDLS